MFGDFRILSISLLEGTLGIALRVCDFLFQISSNAPQGKLTGKHLKDIDKIHVER